MLATKHQLGWPRRWAALAQGRCAGADSLNKILFQYYAHRKPITIEETVVTDADANANANADAPRGVRIKTPPPQPTRRLIMSFNQ